MCEKHESNRRIKMAGLFETVTKEDPTFVSDSEKNAQAAAQSAANAKQSEDLSKGYMESAAASASQAAISASSIDGILDQVTTLRDETQTLHDSTESLATQVDTQHTDIVAIQADVEDLSSQVRNDRDMANVAMQNASISANNAGSYADAAQQSVQDAADQVVLAQEQVTLATNQVTLAKAQADRAESIADTVQDEVDLAHDWAVKMDGMVNGEDYSAKYWAAQAENAAAGGVTSFNGRAGIVSPQTGDYTVEQVTGAVPSTRTINGHDLSADIVLTAADIGVSDDALLKANNLSDVANVTTARSNLGAAPIASPTFTGTPAAPTATAGTSTTQIATTAFVSTGLALKANIANPTFTGTVTIPTLSVTGAATGTSLVLSGQASAKLMKFGENYNFSVPDSLSSYIGHHRAGTDEMDFVNVRGTSNNGGFKFYSGTTTSNTAEIFSIDGTGNTVFSNNTYMQSRLAGSTSTSRLIGMDASNVITFGDSTRASAISGTTFTNNATNMVVNGTALTVNSAATFNGTVAVPTVATTTSSTAAASTAFVKAAIAADAPVFVSTANPGGTQFNVTTFTKVPFYSPTDGSTYFNTDTFTAPSAGLYQFNFEVRFDGATATLPVGKEFMLTLSGTTAPTGGVAGQCVGEAVAVTARKVAQLNTVIKMTSGQQMCAYIWHNNTSNITVTWATLKITRLGGV